MTDAERIEAAEPPPGVAEAGSWQAHFVLIGVPVVTIGFFFLAWLGFDYPASGAAGMALGAGLGALVALSVLGAIANARRGRSHAVGEPEAEGPRTEEPRAEEPRAED